MIDTTVDDITSRSGQRYLLKTKLDRSVPERVRDVLVTC